MRVQKPVMDIDKKPLSPWVEKGLGQFFRNCYTLRCDFLEEAVAEAFQFAAINIS